MDALGELYVADTSDQRIRLLTPITGSAFTSSGSITHLASGGYWTTMITLINSGSAPAQASLNFFDDKGNSLTLPLSSPQNSFNPMTASTFTGTVNAGAELVIQSTGPSSQPTLTGWAQLLTSGNIGGFAESRKRLVAACKRLSLLWRLATPAHSSCPSTTRVTTSLVSRLRMCPPNLRAWG